MRWLSTCHKCHIDVCYILNTWNLYLNIQFCSRSDLDECRLMPGACQNGRCINTLGSYRCLCNPGYQVDPTRESQCIDVDECSVLNPSPCEFGCRNTPGSYTCVCPAGYVTDRDGRTCVDVDECNVTASGRPVCPQACVNTRGSFECTCNPGYQKHGNHCVGKPFLLVI